MILPGIERKIISTPHLKNGWEGSIIDLIYNEEIPFNERLLIVIESELISSKLLRVFSVWCARRVLQICPSSGLSNLLDVVEQYANSTGSFVEVENAYFAARKEFTGKTKSTQFKEAEAAVYATIDPVSRDAAKRASRLSVAVLGHYNVASEIEKKHLWKIRDLVLENLTKGEVEFILKNQFPNLKEVKSHAK